MWLAKLSISLRSCEEMKTVVFSRARQQPLDQLIAHQRIEPGEGLVEHNQFWTVSQRGGHGRLIRTMREVAQLARGRQVELADQLAGQRVVPGGIRKRLPLISVNYVEPGIALRPPPRPGNSAIPEKETDMVTTVQTPATKTTKRTPMTSSRRPR